jgi:hypothetical protein
MKVHNFAHLSSKERRHSPFDPRTRTVADLAMNEPGNARGLLLQLLTVDVEPYRLSGHQNTGNFSGRFGKPVWIEDCITIEFPGSLTGWRGISLS